MSKQNEIDSSVKQWVIKYPTPVGAQHVILVGEDVWSRDLAKYIYKYEVPLPLRSANVDAIICWAEAHHNQGATVK